MNKNGLMLKVLEKIDNYKDNCPELVEQLSYILKNRNCFIDSIIHINEPLLYNSRIHGINHSEKVLLFATLIALREKLNDDDMQIITDAAKYHDIGRTTDFDEKGHGLASANKVETIINGDIYKDITNLNMLKAIIEIHSIDDEHESYIFNKYKLGDLKHFKKMYSILKDADALDRKRFCKVHPADLNPKYLRLDISKGLLATSEQINNIYYNLIDERD